MPHADHPSAAIEAVDDDRAPPAGRDTIGDIIAQRYGRRDVLRGALGVAATLALFGREALAAAPADAAAAPRGFDFTELAAGNDDAHHVPEGYRADVLLRWGDAIFADSPPFAPGALTAEAQGRQFGYNNDYIGLIPLDGAADRFLLCVNHEFTIPELMFSGAAREASPERSAVEMAAHGVSVVEIARAADGRFRVVADSPRNRRITAAGPAMAFDGPAAGHPLLRTGADPAGNAVLGTLNNCGGGVTPWGTYLTAEENFHHYFWSAGERPGGGVPRGCGAADSRPRYELPGKVYSWGRFAPRFNLDAEPNEANRFGWIVEIDPADPASTPVKHTALGRFCHEGAEVTVNPDGRVVVFCGDDTKFEYVYRFVSAGRYTPGMPKADAMRLLSEGTLSAARFDAGGTVHWLPLVHGTGFLTEKFGFASQAEVVINARLAADCLGATPMDRPEDVQPNVATGRVYVMLTNNDKRKAAQVTASSPRAENVFGHIIEMTPPGGDYAADSFAWNILVRCGDPRIAAVGAQWHPEQSADGWFACPDNCAMDADGRLWIATDQGDKTSDQANRADGLYALGTAGAERGRSKLFFRAPLGAEVCGPCFTADGTAVFIAVQHPTGRWPDMADGMPPRPSVIVITRDKGGRIA